jgi:hypothetical protein
MKNINIEIRFMVTDPEKRYDWKYKNGDAEISLTLPLEMVKDHDIDWNDSIRASIIAAYENMIANNQPEPEDADEHTN